MHEPTGMPYIHTYMHTHTHTHTHLFKSISMMYTTNAFIAAAVTVVTAGDGAEARGPPRLGDRVRGRGMTKGERRPVFCRLHRKEGHIDVINRRQVCDRGVSCIAYCICDGVPAPGGRHRKEGHVDFINRRQVF